MHADESDEIHTHFLTVLPNLAMAGNLTSATSWSDHDKGAVARESDVRGVELTKQEVTRLRELKVREPA